MSKLPRDVPAKKIISALERTGFQVDRVSGSHYVLIKGSLRVVVPFHKAVKIGTLKAILTQENLTLEELMKLI